MSYPRRLHSLSHCQAAQETGCPSPRGQLRILFPQAHLRNLPMSVLLYRLQSSQLWCKLARQQQPALLDPLGRSFRVELRKLF